MHESVPVFLGPVGDDRHSACMDQCETDIMRCTDNASARATDNCDRKYRSCAERCDREEGVVKI